MKKLLTLISAVMFLTATMAMGQISGTDHDFSQSGWADGRICLPCHTPHHADITVSLSPLWNHEVTSAVFTPYPDSPTMDATSGQPDGISKLCLSCHDGTVAIDSYGGATGSNMITGGSLIGTNLSDDHPISITYDAALAVTDGELFDPTTELSGLGGTIQEDMLFGDEMECSSCHDVHAAPGGVPDGLLVKNNNSSALCLTCHDK